jgi:hypothetical protein
VVPTVLLLVKTVATDFYCLLFLASHQYIYDSVGPPPSKLFKLGAEDEANYFVVH